MIYYDHKGISVPILETINELSQALNLQVRELNLCHLKYLYATNSEMFFETIDCKKIEISLPPAYLNQMKSDIVGSLCYIFIFNKLIYTSVVGNTLIFRANDGMVLYNTNTNQYLQGTDEEIHNLFSS